MKSLQIHKGWYIFGVLILGAVALLLLRTPHKAVATDTQAHNGPYWEARIHAVGGKAAYAELADALAGKDPNVSHQAAHVFGGALFRAEGLPGISVCDTGFIYGCFHQFVAEAITAKGLDVLDTIGTLCADNLQCLHGIGHGILADIGYNPAAAQQATTACLQLPKHDLFSGCIGGVFMEYALRSMLTDTRPRMLTAHDDVLSPCNRVAPEYAGTCYYWQAQTWKLSWQASTTPAALFTHMGELCRGVGGENRLFCFAGIGAAAVSVAQYDPSALSALCDSTSGELMDQALCRAAGGKALAGAVSEKIGEQTCTGLPGATNRACLRYIATPATPADFTL